MVGKATSFASSRSVLSEHAYPLTIENQTDTPARGKTGATKKRSWPRKITTKNNAWVGLAWGRQPVVNQPSSPRNPTSCTAITAKRAQPTPVTPGRHRCADGAQWSDSNLLTGGPRAPLQPP